MTLSTEPHPRPATGLETPARGLGLGLVLAGLIGLIAASVLLVEKIELLKNPGYIPSCNLNPILSCGSVMSTAQAEAFAVPNPMLGVAGFAALMAIGTALLAGATFQRWLWLLVQSGVTFGVGFVHWLIWQSLYEIGALCPYCMVVWTVMIPVFVFTTLHVLRLFVGESNGLLNWMVEFRLPVLTAWYLVIVAMIGERFWYYWSTLV